MINVYITGCRGNYRAQVVSAELLTETTAREVAVFEARSFDYANDAIDVARGRFKGCAVYLNGKPVTW